MAIDPQKITARRNGRTSGIVLDRPNVRIGKQPTLIQWVKGRGETFDFVGVVPSFSPFGPIAVTADLITMPYSGTPEDASHTWNYAIVAQTSSGILLSTAALPPPPSSGPTIRNH